MHVLEAPLPPPFTLFLATHFHSPDLAARLDDYAEAWAETPGAQKIELHGKSGLYMTRYFIEDRGEHGRTYLHHIHRPDEDPEYHDHPWDFDAWILAGGYMEERPFSLGRSAGVCWTLRPAGTHYHLDANAFHRIATIIDAPCWSVIRTGPKQKSWSFFNANTRTYTPWRDFIRAKGQEVIE